MTLHRATLPDGTTPSFPTGPVPCVDLVDLAGLSFDLPCDDPWLLESSSEAHTYLQAADRAWTEHEEWMDFLDLGSPCNHLKRAERDLYMHHWRDWLEASSVLDVGCGIGRMSMPWLDRGATVHGVDGDLQSLQRCAWHAAGRAGALDLHWSSVHTLPKIDPVDVVIACEVLCYVPDINSALRGIRERLKPGGALLISMEAPWGWAASEDAPEGAMQAALAGPGVVFLEDDRWVRTYDRQGIEVLLGDAGFTVESCIPTHYLTDGPLERCLDGSISLEELVALEDTCRQHPVWGPLNRIWTIVARRPEG